MTLTRLAPACLYRKSDDAVIDHEEIKEFVAEPWFILLMAGLVTLMIVLLAAILFVRYRQLGAKKSHLGGTSRKFFTRLMNRTSCGFVLHERPSFAADTLRPVNKLSYSSGFKTTLDANHRGQVTTFLQSEHSVSNRQRCLFIDANSCRKPNW